MTGPESPGAGDGAALAALRQLRARVDELEARGREPLAVVGIGCRFPGGARGPEELWRLLVDGVDTVTEIPGSRWPLPADDGERSERYGSFIDDVDVFDPYFFGISPREATRMDPQQRHFLEVAWEALENAGLTREELAGSSTGVFVGANATDYMQLQMAHPELLDSYTTAGGANSLIANRLSYLLDLRAPSMTVDTACSSALVAVHLAGQSLRARECDAAVVGGVNIVLSPTVMSGFGRIGALSPTGRCHTFDARADGYVRGEGAGAVVLKRLSDAQAAGDRVWAVIEGSAVNQDGLTNGLTAPSGPAQREVVRLALERARLEPGRITLLEAHGTGTPLGDPIEVEALAEAYGSPHEAGPPCALGSIKTNIGHLEAAAGIAGLIKAVLSLHHRTLVANRDLELMNPHLSLDGTRLYVPAAATPWTADDRSRHAAVSSFGAGGTNAHVVLGPAPEPTPEPEQAGDAGPWLLALSARTPEALTALARAHRDHLLGPEGGAQALRDVAHSAAHRRTWYEHRAVVVADTHAETARRLDEWARGDEPAGVGAGRVAAGAGGEVVFVCSGHGSQRIGMGRELMTSCEPFRTAMRECDAALAPHLGFSVIDAIHHEGPLPDRLDIVQPALFAVAVGLAARWRSLGVEPDMIVGHSMGEVAAAHLAGALSLADAARVISLRSRLLGRLRGAGHLLVVGLPADECEELIAEYQGGAWTAVSNSPTSTVLAGDEPTLARVAERLAARNVFHRPLSTSVAGHGPQVEAIQDDVMAGLAGLTPHPTRIPLISTVTGEICEGSALDAAYWYRNLRLPVQFWSAVQVLVAKGARTFVELGPHPMLLSAVTQSLDLAGQDGLALASMRRDEPETHPVLEGIGAMHARGATTVLPRLTERGRIVSLPRYPWQHERFWFRTGEPAVPAPRVSAATEAVEAAVPAVPAVAPPAARPRTEAVFALVAGTVADVLGYPAERLDPDLGFFQMGMDSILATQVRRRLDVAFGRRLSTPVLFEHPTVRGLTEHLVEYLGADAPPASPDPAPPTDPAPVTTPDPVATPAAGLSEDELLRMLAAELRPSTTPQENVR